MAIESQNRNLQPSPAESARKSLESVQPTTIPPTPVAQSIEPKMSRTGLKETQHGRQEPEPLLEDVPLERPSLHSARHSWRSGRPQSWAPDDRDDRRSYRAIASYDYGTPSKAPAGREYADSYFDYRGSYYDHPYSHYPFYPPPSQRRSVPPRGSWRSSSTITALPTQGPPPPPPQAAEESGDETEDERTPTPRPKRLQQRPLTWGYDYTPPPPSTEAIMRLPFTWWMNSGVKDHFVSALSECVGTIMFLFFAFAGTQVANINANSGASASTTNAATGFSPIVLTYISLSFGFSLMVNVWIFYRISGGLFNPAVTLGMVMVKSLSYTRGILLCGAQIVGSIITSLIVKVLFPVDFNVRTTLSEDTSLVQGVFIEGLLTAELVFAIFMLAKEKHRASYLAPIGIGIALFIAELVGVYYTGGSLNPARSFGPCVVTGIWDKEHWIYWVGPCCGAIGAVGFYNFIKVLEYEMANPGQDSASEQKAEKEAEQYKNKKDEGRNDMV